MIKKRAVLFANGDYEPGGNPAKLINDTDYLVAVDGGLRHLEALGYTPDLLIGDLDSVTPAQLERYSRGNTEVIKFPVAKDETDLELALLEVVRRGVEEILIMGALGGRIDQTLANLFLLLLPDLVGRDVRLITRTEEIFVIQKNAVIHGAEQDVVSLIPLNGDAAGVTTTGLLYPLNEETLYFNRSRGISNRMLTGKAEVRLRDGVLLCVHTRNIAKESYE